MPTRVLDEDQYPVGGYTSISTRGSIESLLHSQLAYMEPESPDLFDMKFVRDELFYYSPRREPVPPPPAGVRVRAVYPDLVPPGSRTPTCRPADRPGPVRRPGPRPPADRLAEHRRAPVRGAVRPGRATRQPLGRRGDLLQLLLREPIERGAARGRAGSSRPAAVEQFLRGPVPAQSGPLPGGRPPSRSSSSGEGRSCPGLVVNGPRPEV